MTDAEAALRSLAIDVVAEAIAAQSLELTERARQDAALELSWPVWDDDAVPEPARAASAPVRTAPAAAGPPVWPLGPPGATPGVVTRDGETAGPYPGPAGPPVCADPFCDHMTLRCPRSRTHLVGGHPAHRSHLISAGSTVAPAGSASARGQGSQALTAAAGDGDEIELAAVHVRAYERTTEEGKPQHVRSHTRQEETGLEHPGDLRGLGPAGDRTRWIAGAPPHFVDAISDPQWKAGQALWVGRGQAASGRAATPEHAATAFAARAGAIAPALLGGGHQAWNGSVRLFNAADEPHHSAELAWDGTMGLQRELATKLRDELPGTGTVADPQPYVTTLHELTHGTVPPGQTHAMHSRAYADPANAAIEEGFTEYGTIVHAPEFFNALGIGGRETPITAVDDAGHVRERFDTGQLYARQQELRDLAREAGSGSGPGSFEAYNRLHDAEYALFAPELNVVDITTHLAQAAEATPDPALREKINGLLSAFNVMGTTRRATMAEYAERLADPERIAAGTAWGHYGWQAAAAQKWATDAAEATGRPARELADEVNREGVGGKVPAMARQAIRAAGADPDELAGAPFVAVENVIRANWPEAPGQGLDPWAQAVAEAKYRTPAPPETGKTSGLMKAGDMVHSQGGDYQAIAQAPVSWSAGSAYHEIDGQTVKGSWSDPWWMTRQGGGWAVSRRWKSKAQTGFGGWDAASNRYVSVPIPAKDQRVLTAWYPGAGTGTGQDTQALYAATEGGGYTAGRAALHEQIISDALAGAEPVEHPVATFMGGGPASGKSAMLAVRPAQGVVIDPDAIKAQLPEYAEGVKRRDPTAAALVHEESSDIAKEIQRRAIGRSVHFTLDGTGDSSYAKMARKVQAARAAGYQVAARYVTVDTEAALVRIVKRAERTGRLVPAAYAREIHASVSDVFARAVADDLFDSAELWDNNGERGSAIKLIGARKPGGSWTVADRAAWQRFLDKAYTGATEAQARAAETGKAAASGAG